MERNLKSLKNFIPLGGALLGIVLTTPPILAQTKTVQHPISDFVDQQGTYCYTDGLGSPCLLFTPPIQNFIGWTNIDYKTQPQQGPLCASVDYAGLANKWLIPQGVDLETQTAGQITETQLPDGRGEVYVRLHTSNALAWVVYGTGSNNSGSCDFEKGPLAFGYRAPTLLLEPKIQPALADSFVTFKFTNAHFGDPLPDMIQLLFFPLPGQQVIAYSAVVTATGSLWSQPPQGSTQQGVETGTGKLKITQRGLLQIPSNSPSFKNDDTFPVELINLIPIQGGRK